MLGACACIAETTVNVQATTSISDIQLKFDVTEDNLLHNTTSPPLFFEGRRAATSGRARTRTVRRRRKSATNGW